jgi:Aminotransferase class I and II
MVAWFVADSTVGIQHADEVYEHLVFAGHKHVSIRSLPGMADRVVRLGSAGKTFSLTAWKVSFDLTHSCMLAAAALSNATCRLGEGRRLPPACACHKRAPSMKVVYEPTSPAEAAADDCPLACSGRHGGQPCTPHAPFARHLP